MKKLLLILFVLNSFLGYSQDTVRITHTNYSTVFSVSKHYPVKVDWWLTKAKVSCDNPRDRVNNFAADPLLPGETNLNSDYAYSGYDRGHMCDDRDNLCQGDKVQSECFYFSNMAPQFHSLNAGSWKRLEGECRVRALRYDSIHIWAGSVGEVKKIGRVSVPSQCWKVLFIKKTGEYHAYIFQNTKDDSGNTEPETTLDSIKVLTGLSF